ncbi:uncharacterized protein LOC126673351 [Mercurialis annua]|uniref:uncharacterized protein LOC126673351 n=1 Tax=Mercurialis annua TaxID=3986 RepID=UPI00215E8DAE|nr:uncharacterized protein LOC126673351 [Mercurialis annua]
MEFFNKAKIVRFRSYHDKFLIADEDEETVRQSHDGSSHRARWTVEFIPGNSHLIRLKSFNGKYLTASDEFFLLGMAGKRVAQANLPVSEKDSINWEPRTTGFHVKLRTRGGKFLRANGRTPPGRYSVTHDIPHRTATQDWILWKVEMVDILEFGSVQKGYQSPFSSFSDSFSSDFAGSECSEVGFPIVNHVSSDRYEFEAKKAMEIFQKAQVVRLRSHHDKYLIADEDEETVTQDRNGLVQNAKWIVEIVESSQCLRFKSCYGKYLTASNMPFLLGITAGKKVIQTLPRRLDSSLEWEPIREGVQIKLKTRYGQYLRANTSLPPWRSNVTHDIPHRTSTQDWILWDVDLVERRVHDPAPAPQKPITNRVEIVRTPEPPRIGNNNNNNTNSNQQVEDAASSEPGSPSSASKFARTESDDSTTSVPVKSDGRVIHYSVANEKGEVDENKKKSFTFKGSVVEELKNKLEEETGVVDFLVCSKNQFNGKLYPLLLHLPPNNSDMSVVVVPSSAKAQFMNT